MRNQRRENRRGLSLIETAIVLGVVGLVIGGIWVAAAAVQENFRQSRAQRDVLAIVSNLRQLFSQTNVPFNVTVYASNTNTALNSSVFPADAISGTATINPWGLRYSVQVAGEGSASQSVPTAAIFVFVPDAAVCSQLGQRLYAAIRNNQGALVDIVSDGSFGLASPDPAETITLCREAEDGANGEPLYLNVYVPL